MTKSEIQLAKIQTLENEIISYAMLSAQKREAGKDHYVEDAIIRSKQIDMKRETRVLLYKPYN